MNTKNEVQKNIIELFEINKLPEEKQEEAITRIGNIIFQSVLIKVLPTLNEKDLVEYEKMMDLYSTDKMKGRGLGFTCRQTINILELLNYIYINWNL